MLRAPPSVGDLLTSRTLRCTRCLSRAWCAAAVPGSARGAPVSAALVAGARGNSGLASTASATTGRTRSPFCGHRRALALPASPGCAGALLAFAARNLPAGYRRRGSAAGGFVSHKATRTAGLSSLPLPTRPSPASPRHLHGWAPGRGLRRRAHPVPPHFPLSLPPPLPFYKTPCFLEPTSVPQFPGCNAWPRTRDRGRSCCLGGGHGEGKKVLPLSAQTAGAQDAE